MTQDDAVAQDDVVTGAREHHHSLNAEQVG
ncbi:MAG: hypothetical protein QOJ30_2655, partial [Pseudonocardiales bacterium]|nr:hypothetical protein [Pseudonocardiales bacterium]